MNLKLILIGGVVFYAVAFIVSLGTGPVIHEGVLDADYRATESFWRPELRQDPPDMAALMPRWIAGGLLSAFIFAGIFGVVRSSLAGSPAMKGFKFGIIASLFMCMFCLGWSGIFDLPDRIWMWWGAESFLYNLPAGAALGWVAGKIAP
jgi:hypothetical protein